VETWVSETHDQDDAASVLLAGPPGRVTEWYQALMADSRFRVGTFASDPEDLQRKIANQPEVVILDAGIFAGPQPLIELLTSLPAAAYVLLPSSVPEDVRGQIQAVPSVKGAYLGDFNLAEVAGRIYDTAMSLRAGSPSFGAPWLGDHRRDSVAGLRIVTVWNEAGGMGKTTVATNLAYEAARRRYRTLLIGLGAPDDLPLVLGLEPEPNLAGWQANPTPEGLKSLVQPLSDLDVIAGFRTVIDESRALGVPAEKPESIPSLAMTAAYNGYAVIVLDTPPSSIAPAAIMAANTLILVSRPTASGAQRTVEAYRTVVQRLAGEHRIAPANIYVVLNMMNSGDFAADEWHKMVAGALRRAGLGAPPIAVAISDDPAVRGAQNDAKMAMLVSDNLARGIHSLADALFGTRSNGKPAEDASGFTIGGIRFRIRK
jgi:arsenite-transporting ATPase